MRQEICAALILTAEERAELAFILTNISVVDISVDDESRRVAEFFLRIESACLPSSNKSPSVKSFKASPFDNRNSNRLHSKIFRAVAKISCEIF